MNENMSHQNEIAFAQQHGDGPNGQTSNCYRTLGVDTETYSDFEALNFPYFRYLGS